MAAPPPSITPTDLVGNIVLLMEAGLNGEPISLHLADIFALRHIVDVVPGARTGIFQEKGLSLLIRSRLLPALNLAMQGPASGQPPHGQLLRQILRKASPASLEALLAKKKYYTIAGFGPLAYEPLMPKKLTRLVVDLWRATSAAPEPVVSGAQLNPFPGFSSDELSNTDLARDLSLSPWLFKPIAKTQIIITGPDLAAGDPLWPSFLVEASVLIRAYNLVLLNYVQSLLPKYFKAVRENPDGFKDSISDIFTSVLGVQENLALMDQGSLKAKEAAWLAFLNERATKSFPVLEKQAALGNLSFQGHLNLQLPAAQGIVEEICHHTLGQAKSSVMHLLKEAKTNKKPGDISKDTKGAIIILLGDVIKRMTLWLNEP